MEYHGTGAFNLTRWGEWDCVFLEMMEQPVNKIIIQARRRGGGGGGLAGGSKNNPFIKVCVIVRVFVCMFVCLIWSICVCF